MTITPYNPTSVLVSSTTQDGVDYLIDLETLECGCPGALDFGTASPQNPCIHLRAVLAYLGRKTAPRRRIGAAFTILKCKRTSTI